MNRTCEDSGEGSPSAFPEDPNTPDVVDGYSHDRHTEMQVSELGHVDPGQLLHGLDVVCPDGQRRKNGEVDVADILDYLRPGVPVYAIEYVTQGEHLNSPQLHLGNHCQVLLLCPIPTDFIKWFSYFASPPPPPLLSRHSFPVLLNIIPLPKYPQTLISGCLSFPPILLSSQLHDRWQR